MSDYTREIETLDDVLGYDADHSDARQYCRHGNFTGSWWGPDYLCGLCEDGVSICPSCGEWDHGADAEDAHQWYADLREIYCESCAVKIRGEKRHARFHVQIKSASVTEDDYVVDGWFFERGSDHIAGAFAHFAKLMHDRRGNISPRIYDRTLGEVVYEYDYWHYNPSK